MPNLSLLGHLAGIITGTMHVYGVLDLIAIPGEAALKEMEQWRSLRLLCSSPHFVPTPSGRDLTRSPVELRHSICSLGRSFAQHAGGALDAVKVVICGGGTRMNANIQLETVSAASLKSLVGHRDDDEDDWSGLPGAAADRQMVSQVV
jgi:hypothetical protein